MKKTLRKLTWKTIATYFYLPLILATFFSLIESHPALALGDSYANDGLTGFLKMILLITMMIHWFYGAIYYPPRYRNYVKALQQNEFTRTFPHSDASRFRGYLVSGILLTIIAIDRVHTGDLRHFLPGLAWLLTLIFASFQSQTSSLFVDKVMEMNKVVILQTLGYEIKVDKREEDNDSYFKVCYLVPTHQDAGDNTHTEEMIAEACCINHINRLQINWLESQQRTVVNKKELETNRKVVNSYCQRIAEKVKNS